MKAISRRLRLRQKPGEKRLAPFADRATSGARGRQGQRPCGSCHEPMSAEAGRQPAACSTRRQIVIETHREDRRRPTPNSPPEDSGVPVIAEQLHSGTRHDGLHPWRWSPDRGRCRNSSPRPSPGQANHQLDPELPPRRSASVAAENPRGLDPCPGVQTIGCVPSLKADNMVHGVIPAQGNYNRFGPLGIDRQRGNGILPAGQG